MLKTIVDNLYANDLIVQPLSDRISPAPEDQYDHYYSESRNSNGVVCCFGESWIKGCGLEPNQYRDVIGAALSRDLGWDFVNAGAKGFSNSWAFSNFEYMIDWLNASNYTQGVIHIALTENGRDIEKLSFISFAHATALSRNTEIQLINDLGLFIK